jgi:hypothetical protein
MARNAIQTVLALLGGAIGGTLGYLAFFWILSQGFYALPLPVVLLGAGCGLLAGAKSSARGLVCAAAAILLSLVVEWRAFPFGADDSLEYFLYHVHELKPITLIMIATGAAAAYWLGEDSLTGARVEPRPAAPADAPVVPS